MISEENAMASTAQSVKEIGHQLVEELPEKATLKDLSDAAYVQYLRGLVDEGIADLEAGRVVTQEEIEARYPLP